MEIADSSQQESQPNLNESESKPEKKEEEMN